MDDEQKQPFYSDDQFADKLVKVGAAAVLFAFLVVLFYLFQFYRLEISKDPSDWGSFGDYVGGLVNPAIGLVTVVLVIFSINIQRRELRASIQEMRLANQATNRISFEQTLFAWINNYHALVSSISIGDVRGRQALQKLYDENLSEGVTIQFWPLPPALKMDAKTKPGEVYLRIDAPGDKGLQKVAPFFLRAVIEFQRLAYKHKSELDAPIRTLHQLIKWIDQSTLSNNEKWHYRTILKSQLSWVELVFLFYSNLTINDDQHVHLINKYAMLDKLVRDDFLLLFAETKITPTPKEHHPQLRDGHRPWPYQSSAFSEEEARTVLKLTE